MIISRTYPEIYQHKNKGIMDAKDYAKERFLKTIMGILLLVIITSIAVSNEWIILVVLIMLFFSTLLFKLMEYLNN